MKEMEAFTIGWIDPKYLKNKSEMLNGADVLVQYLNLGNNCTIWIDAQTGKIEGYRVKQEAP